MTQAETTQRSQDDGMGVGFPPYGLPNADNAAYLADRPIPEGFRVDPTSPLPGDADDWQAWLTELALEMADFLWPVYQREQWVGRAALHAAELTRADLDLMQRLQPKMDERIRGAISPTEHHRTAWAQEDEGAPGRTLAFYQVTVPPELKADFDRAIVTGGIDVARPASQGLKKQFQRPRPQLTALMLALKGGLSVQPSKSAITPSMISGHCIQGSMALAQVHYWLAHVLQQQPGLLDVVDRFLIDTGDRRVFAGLHYPSDNVGSWFVAMRLCMHVYGDQGAQVRSALWKAIRAHSVVFAAMQKQGGVYQALLDKLEAVANTPSANTSTSGNRENDADAR